MHKIIINDFQFNVLGNFCSVFQKNRFNLCVFDVHFIKIQLHWVFQYATKYYRFFASLQDIADNVLHLI